MEVPPKLHGQRHCDWHSTHRCEAGYKRLARSCRNDNAEQHDPRRYPGQTTDVEMLDLVFEPLVHPPVLRHRDPEAPHDFKRQPDVDERLRRQLRPRRYPRYEERRQNRKCGHPQVEKAFGRETLGGKNQWEERGHEEDKRVHERQRPEPRGRSDYEVVRQRCRPAWGLGAVSRAAPDDRRNRGCFVVHGSSRSVCTRNGLVRYAIRIALRSINGGRSPPAISRRVGAGRGPHDRSRIVQSDEREKGRRVRPR